MGSGSSKAKKTEVSEKDKTKAHRTLVGHTGGINCMDISSSGMYLLTGSDDRTARVWDLVTYENKIVLEGHAGYISCCRILQDRYALTGSVDKTVRKWNILSGNCILQMEQHSGMINRMLVFGTYLFTSSYDRTVVCWNVEDGQAVRVFRGHRQGVLPLIYVKTAEHDPKGAEDVDRNKDVLITGSMDCTAKIWSIGSSTSLITFRGHKGAVLCLTVDKDKKFLFTGSTDYTIKKWNVANGMLLKSFKGHEGSVICLEKNHKLLYSASVDSSARCWVAEFGDTTRKYVGHEHMLSDMKYHNGLLITGSGDSTVRVFDAKSGTLKRTFKGHKYAVNCILPVDNTILSASYDGSVRIWNIRDLMREKLSADADSCSSFVSSEPSMARIREQSPTPSAPAMSEINETEPPVERRGGRSKKIALARELRSSQMQNDFDQQSIARSTLITEREDVNDNLRSAAEKRHRRQVKANRNKVAPMVSTNGNTNQNNNAIVNLTDGMEDLDDILQQVVSDSASEGYTSRSSSTVPHTEAPKDRNVNNKIKTPPQDLSTMNDGKPPYKPRRIAATNSKSSLYSNTVPLTDNTRSPRAKEGESPSLTSSGTIASVSISLPSTSNSSRTSPSDNSETGEPSGVRRKRVKTDGTNGDEHSKSPGSRARMSPEDLAIVDEEMKMIAVETDSTSTGYHSDKSASHSPNIEKPNAQSNNKNTPTKSGSKINSAGSVTRKTPQRPKTIAKNASRSSLWATCSNSVDTTNAKAATRGKSIKGVNSRGSSNSANRVKNTLPRPPSSESTRLENEILQM